MTKDKSIYVRHIYDCVARIKEYVRDGEDAFFRDRKTQDAVIRNLEVIGQAVKETLASAISRRVSQAYRGRRSLERAIFSRIIILASI